MSDAFSIDVLRRRAGADKISLSASLQGIRLPKSLILASEGENFSSPGFGEGQKGWLLRYLSDIRGLWLLSDLKLALRNSEFLIGWYDCHL